MNGSLNNNFLVISKIDHIGRLLITEMIVFVMVIVAVWFIIRAKIFIQNAIRKNWFFREFSKFYIKI